MRKKNLFTFFLLPFSWIYGIIISVRNKCFDLGIFKSEEFDIPVISVGNITVGGTGKTPHIEYLVRLLKDGFKVGVLSRGYKRKTKGFILADENSDAEMIGDEPFQVKRKFPGILVAVDADRSNGIKKILEAHKDIDVILLDDAFQHRYVKPGLSLLLIDFNRPVTEDYLLPSGSLRETASGRKRADIIIISKSPEKISENEQKTIINSLNINSLQSFYFTKVIQKEPVPVFGGIKIPDFIQLFASKPSVLLVSGIANPRDLKRFALNISPKITEKYFPDHHIFTNKDVSNIIRAFTNLEGERKILITTEKDAARFQKYSDLPEEIKIHMFYIPISIAFLNEEEEKFNNQIITYVNENKRNSFLHKGKNEIPA
jgi:tetraacyldisaccharide 4'-kinase